MNENCRRLRSIVIFSGGMDSTTLLTQAKIETDIVGVLTFNYGQRHSIEIERAAQIIDYLALDDVWHLIDLTSLKDTLSTSALLGGQDVPKALYDHETQQATIVPNRNLIMLSIAAAHAINYGADVVYYGAHTGDHTIYPDCRQEFINAATAAIQIGMDTHIAIVAPFINMSKIDIALKGVLINAPLHLSWTCYSGAGKDGKDRPCLQCGSCLERTEAFHKNGMIDPALTLIEWKQAVACYENAIHKAEEEATIREIMNAGGVDIDE